MEEVKILTGGLNQDDSPESVNQSDYTSANNFRNTGTSEAESAYGTNIESTQLVTPEDQLGAGLNKTIGGEGFKNVKKAYSVKYNSGGRHIITELDYTTLIESTIFTDLDDSGGEQIFNISPKHYFSDLKLFQEKYLIMTDGVSGLIYCINIERLKSGGYGVVSQDAFNLLKPQTLVPIKAEYVDDPNKKSNLLKGKLFQFRQQNGFADYMKSAWSTISNRPVPEMEITDSVGDDPSKLNAIKLTVDIGDELVTDINLASRAELYDWYIFKNVKRDYILNLPNTEIDIEEEIYEAYDPATNKYTLLFYNDGTQEAVPALDTDELYDNIPLNAGALEIVNGDIITLGDLTEGYDRPEGIEVSVSVSAYKPQLDISINNPRNFGGSVTLQERIPSTHRRYPTIEFYGSPKAGDKVFIQLGDIRNSIIANTISYTVTPSDEDNLTSFIDNLYNLLPATTANPSAVYRKRKSMDNPTKGRVAFVTDSYQEVKGLVFDLDETGDVEGRTLNIIKSNTSYQLALFHFDKFGRPFPILTGDEYVANTTSYAETEGLVTSIGWGINGTPPEGAVSYQWGLSENTKFANTLWVTGIYDEVESKDDYIIFNLASLDRYVRDSETGIVAYDFTEGDRVTFQHSFSSSSTPDKWFNNPPLDFAVSGFEIKVDTETTPNETKYLLKIKKSSVLPIIDLTDKEVLLEIYTPKKNNENIDTKVFYEMGEQFDIIDGQYSVTSGSITKGDAYIRPRKFLSNVEDSNDVFALPVQDLNFSDDYISNFWSAGRGRTYRDEVGRVRRKASFRYGDTFAIGSLNNNINRFYANRIYGDEPAQTTSIYGAIIKMVMRDNYLIVLQELKVGHVPVNSSILEDQAEQQNVAISNKLFNNIRYMPSNMGTGLARKAISVSGKNAVYFIDPNNGYPCRDGYDGLKIINVKMSKYFVGKLKNVDPDSIVAYYDDFNEEWNVTFTDAQGDIQVISFSQAEWQYRDDYDLTVDDVTIVQPEHGTVTEVDGNLLYTPDTDYIGNDTVGIVFVVNSQVITKNACINVLAGDSEVQEFSFVDVFFQELGIQAVSNDNFVTGATVPVAISITGGQYRINDGAWTSTAGTINPNDKFAVRVLTSADYEETTSTTLTVGDKSATFNATTKPETAPFESVEKSGTATKNNCPVGSTPSPPVTYVVEAGRYSSYISQEDADAKAQADVDANKQANANEFGTCIVTTPIGNDFQSQTFIKNDCTGGLIGSSYVYSVAPNTFYAANKTAANNLALADIAANGQSTANSAGTCSSPSYFTFQVVMYGNYRDVRYNPTDSRGLSFQFANGGGYTNNFASKLVSTVITRNGVTHTFSIPFAGTSVDLLAVKAYLTTSSTSVAGSFPSRLYHNGTLVGAPSQTVSAGIPTNTQYILTVATSLSTTLTSGSVVRLEHGTAPVAPTYYSAYYSASATKNNCGEGQTGSTVTLVAEENAFTSTISQIDADNQAISYVEANKQSNANTYGTCSVVCTLAISTSKTNETSTGGNNGTITITATGAVGALQFSKDNGTTWVSGTSPYTFTGLAPATYIVKAKDANNCQATASVTINPFVPSGIPINVQVQNISGSNATVGSVSFGGTGSTIVFSPVVSAGVTSANTASSQSSTPISLSVNFNTLGAGYTFTYYSYLYKNGTLIDTKSLVESTGTAQTKVLTHTGVSISAGDNLKTVLATSAYNPYYFLADFEQFEGNSSSACSLVYDDEILLYTPRPDGTIEIGDTVYSSLVLGKYEPWIPAPGSEFISFTLAGVRIWIQLNSSGIVVAKGVCGSTSYYEVTNMADNSIDGGTICAATLSPIGPFYSVNSDGRLYVGDTVYYGGPTTYFPLTAPNPFFLSYIEAGVRIKLAVSTAGVVTAKTVCGDDDYELLESNIDLPDFIGSSVTFGSNFLYTHTITSLKEPLSLTTPPQSFGSGASDISLYAIDNSDKRLYAGSLNGIVSTPSDGSPFPYMLKNISFSVQRFISEFPSETNIKIRITLNRVSGSSFARQIDTALIYGGFYPVPSSVVGNTYGAKSITSLVTLTPIITSLATFIREYKIELLPLGKCNIYYKDI